MLSLPGMLGSGFPDREQWETASRSGSSGATCVTLSADLIAVYILLTFFCNRCMTHRSPRRIDPTGASGGLSHGDRGQRFLTTRTAALSELARYFSLPRYFAVMTRRPGLSVRLREKTALPLMSLARPIALPLPL